MSTRSVSSTAWSAVSGLWEELQAGREGDSSIASCFCSELKCRNLIHCLLCCCFSLEEQVCDAILLAYLRQ